MEFYERNPEYRTHLMLLDDRGCQVTYGDFETFYNKVSGKFRPERLMVLFCENTVGAVFFYLTCLNARVVPILLDKNMDAELAWRLLRKYEPDYLAMPEEMALQESVLRTLTGQREEGSKKPLTNEYGYVVFESGKNPSDRICKDLALLLTTSGSTGSPKLVRQSKKNISANAKSIAQYLELDASERPIMTLPMNYTYGLSVLNSHFLVGAAVLLTRYTLFEKEFWEFFKAAGATSISGVPYTYEILKRLSFFEMELPSLRTMTQAGGKLQPRLHREFAEYAKKTGRNFIVMYGQTEATARMGYLPAKDALRKYGSMGIAIPGGTFRLMEDTHTEILTSDTVGELVYEGDNVTMGYAECPGDLKKGDEWNGILFTGDMAKRDADGYYYITGRKKRFLKLYGKRISMDEIEQMIKQEYEGVDAACTGEDDQMRIYVDQREEKFCQKVSEWLSDRIGIHSSAVRIIPIEKIPKNESGKTLYKELL